MTEQHRITPPPSLVEQWCREYGIEQLPTLACFIADKAAEWSSDQELEACANWVEDAFMDGWGGHLRAARRPKPPSLKEQARQALYRFEDSNGHKGCDYESIQDDFDTIRRALEALPD